MLSLTEIGFVTKQWLDVSGGETGKRLSIRLVVVRVYQRVTGPKEDPPCGRRMEDCIDEYLGRSEPGQPVERRTAEEVSRDLSECLDDRQHPLSGVNGGCARVKDVHLVIWEGIKGEGDFKVQGKETMD